MRAHLFCRGEVDRTRVGFLFSDSGLGQIIEDRFGLYLEIAGQFVDTNLIAIGHSSVGFSFGSSDSSPVFLEVADSSSAEAA
jgi:hypothetical protein